MIDYNVAIGWSIGVTFHYWQIVLKQSMAKLNVEHKGKLGVGEITTW
jgi:hypothetical protein